MNKYNKTLLLKQHYTSSVANWSTMVRKKATRLNLVLFLLISLIAFGVFVPVFALLPSLSQSQTDQLHHHPTTKTKPGYIRKFEISEDRFWKDGQPFQIIGGDFHYFRTLPEYWEDRLLRAKALGLNTIQTYVPWNLHEPRAGTSNFEGIADIVSFLKLCQKHGFTVMLRPGPYICGEWDLGGFPAWLLAIKPALRLRSSDPAFLQLVGKWWGTLLPKIASLLSVNGGPIIMVQIENEYGSYGSDKAYLHHLVSVARKHLGEEVVLYTTDGGSRETLDKGTIRGEAVFSAVDFTTGDNPWPIFELQKEFNAPGKSPPLSSEFYTGWLTHWGEKNAQTDADFTADSLKRILERNGSAVLYMAHGGTNFGFYNGANTGSDESDYKPDLTSYDYDAPIRESGDVSNAKFKAIRKVIEQYTSRPLPPVPSDIEKKIYGSIQVSKTGNLFDMINEFDVVESDSPMTMESLGQMSGFLLYVTEYSAKEYGGGNIVSIPKVHDRAQVFISCPSQDGHGTPTYVGTFERWSNQPLKLLNTKCPSKISLYVLVENMGRLNYGPYIFDMKGILSSVYLDGRVLRGWKMYMLPLANLNENPILHAAKSEFIIMSTHEKLKPNSANAKIEPAFYAGKFSISKQDKIKDTYVSLSGWGKGVVIINNFNIGRYWPLKGPQCNLYVPAPILKHGENIVVVFELEAPNSELAVNLVDQPDFTCGPSKSNLHQL